MDATIPDTADRILRVLIYLEVYRLIDRDRLNDNDNNIMNISVLRLIIKPPNPTQYEIKSDFQAILYCWKQIGSSESCHVIGKVMSAGAYLKPARYQDSEAKRIGTPTGRLSWGSDTH